jgi:hypothetical protein
VLSWSDCARATLILLAGCAPPTATQTPIATRDLVLQITTPVRQTPLGKAFPLTVVRAWSHRLTPEPWSDEALAPLAVRLQDTTQRQDGRHTEETRRYLAHGFTLGELILPRIVIKARPSDGGPERTASSDELRLQVFSALDPETPGGVELPGEPFPAPRRWPLWALLVALLVLPAIVLWQRRRARPQPVATAASGSDTHGRARQRLERLRAWLPRTRAEIRAYHVEVADLVRWLLAERLALHAPELTTEELLVARPTIEALLPAQRATLSALLTFCDRVKFAGHAPTASERQDLLQAAARFLDEMGLSAADPSRTPEGAPA